MHLFWYPFSVPVGGTDNKGYFGPAEIFSVWMRIMSRVQNSQLWLLKLNEGEAAEAFLRSPILSRPPADLSSFGRFR